MLVFVPYDCLYLSMFVYDCLCSSMVASDCVRLCMFMDACVCLSIRVCFDMPGLVFV